MAAAMVCAGEQLSSAEPMRMAIMWREQFFRRNGRLIAQKVQCNLVVFMLLLCLSQHANACA